MTELPTMRIGSRSVPSRFSRVWLAVSWKSPGSTLTPGLPALKALSSGLLRMLRTCGSKRATLKVRRLWPSRCRRRSDGSLDKLQRESLRHRFHDDRLRSGADHCRSGFREVEPGYSLLQGAAGEVRSPSAVAFAEQELRGWWASHVDAPQRHHCQGKESSRIQRPRCTSHPNTEACQA